MALVLLVSAYVLVEFFVEPSRLRTDQHFLCKLTFDLADLGKFQIHIYCLRLKFCVCARSAERLVSVVHLPASGSTQVGGSGDSRSGRRHHHTGSAVVSAPVAPVVLPYLPE